MNLETLVSVIIPTYNRKHTLKRCIDSVLSQTYRNFEIIIVDDCSTDGTSEYIEEQYGDVTDINIVYVRNDNNVGAGACRNIGVSYANGEFIAFHDSDDEWYPDKLAKQMECFLKCNQKVGAVYCSFYMNGQNSVSYPPVNVDIMHKSGNVFNMLLINPLVGMITLIVRKNIFVELGGFNEQLNSLEDYELTIRIAQKYDIILVDEVLAVAYESENSVGKRKKDKLITQFLIMEQFSRELAIAGLKKRKFEDVYKEACKYQQEVFFCNCVMQFSKDEEYLVYAREKWDVLYPSSYPEQISTKDISGVSMCNGCMACYNACPVNAISEGYDKEGFPVPVVDKNKCIQCGRCKEVCPVCNETQGLAIPDDCYAVMSSTEIRKNSSSGGVFKVLADKILEENGYVSGAVWSANWQVEHIVSNDKKDIERMMSSKYVQSKMGEIYAQIKALLEEGKKVFFTGCSCQVAGLKRYLQKEYENLLLADVVCHGVPSPKVFDSYLKDKEKIEEISFRNKEKFGWSTGIYIKYDNGLEYTERKQDSYLFGFLGNWTLRSSCYECKFKNKKYSDLSLGDFWGINQIHQFDDGMGTSFVTLNTTKGALFFKEVLPQFEQIVGLQTEAAKHFNPCISQSVSKPICRELFFDEWNKSTRDDLAEVIQAVKNRVRFDIALVCMWGINYGNALTNYALHTYLQSQGKKIVVLDNYCSLVPIKQFKKFAEEHYCLSSQYFPDYDYQMLNECCNSFVVGSDQNWNYGYAQYYKYNNYFMLDFVEDQKKKTSFAISFGNPEAAVPATIGKALYNRFEAISVREKFAVDLCRDMYGVDAKWVLDPVFLLNKSDYEKMIAGTTLEEKEPYIAVYFLNPSPEKRGMCLKLQQKLGGIKLINMMDANLRNADYCLKTLEYDNIKIDLTVEEWLAYLYHAEYVITDSYHGTCFSMIFEKNFATIKNRESARFETFALLGEVYDRILENGASYDVNELVKDIDYQSVKEKLEVEKEKSKEFIQKHIL